MAKKNNPVITTEKLPLKERIRIAYWCLIGQPFQTELVQKILVIKFGLYK